MFIRSWGSDRVFVYDPEVLGEVQCAVSHLRLAHYHRDSAESEWAIGAHLYKPLTTIERDQEGREGARAGVETAWRPGRMARL